MDWLTQQAQSASPFVASFCLIVCGILIKVVLVLWEQIKFEREEHRKAEEGFALASKEIAVSQVALSRSVNELTAMLTAVVPSLLKLVLSKQDAAE